MEWFLLLLAGFLEIVGSLGIKRHTPRQLRQQHDPSSSAALSSA